MKKLVLFVVLALVLAFAMPTTAAPFTDVPAGHWAQEALERVVEIGIIQGYPDGSFRGTDYINRYQMTVIITRVLDWVLDVAGEDMDMDQVLFELRDMGLTDRQAEEVLVMVRALTMEFRDEIAALDKQMLELRQDLMDVAGEHYDSIFEQATENRRLEFLILGLEEDLLEFNEYVDELEARIAGIEEPTLSFTFNPSVSYRVTAVDGPAGYYNPFSTAAGNVIAPGRFHSYSTPFGIHGRTDLVTLDLTLGMVKPDFAANAELRALTGTVVTPDFTVNLLDRHSTTFRSYLFGTDGRGRPRFGPVYVAAPGVKTTFDKGEIGLYRVGADSVFAFGYNFDLGPLTTRMMLGSEGYLDPYAAGVHSAVELMGINFDFDVATSDIEDVDILVGVGAETTLFDLLIVNAKFDYVDGYTPFYGVNPTVGTAVDGIENIGLSGGVSLPIAIFTVGANYTNRAATHNVRGTVGLTDALELGPVALTADAAYTFNFDAVDVLGGEVGLEFAAGDFLSAEAEYEIRLTDFVVDIHEVEGEVTLTPIAFLSAGVFAGYDILAAAVDPESNVWAEIAPDAYDVFGFTLEPSADVEYYFMGGANGQLNYGAALTLTRALTENTDWVTSGLFAYKEVHPNQPAVNYGNWLKGNTGFKFGSMFNLYFETGMYSDAVDDTLDYTYREIRGGINLSF